MKKFLLSTFMFVVACVAAFAQDVTIKWTANTDWTTDATGALAYTQAPYTVALAKAAASTAPSVNATANDARVYAKGTVTVSTTGANMTKLVFAISSKGLHRQADIIADAGTVLVDTAAQVVTWTGDAKQVVFTVGDKAVHGTDGATKAGQFCFNNVVVSATAGGTTDPGTGTDPQQPALDQIYSEPFNVNLGDFTEDYKVAVPEIASVWTWGGAKYGAKASAFDKTTKAKYVTESWLVSPVIDLTNSTGTVFSFEQAANHFTDEATFKAMCSVQIKEEGGQWTELAYTGMPNGMSWTFVKSEADLKAYDGKKIQIGFRYTSTDQVAGTWELKNFLVEGKLSVAPIVVTPPTFTPAPGVYKDEVTVTIAAEEGHKVYYTLDGTEPTTASTLYEAPFKLTETTKVIAIAVDAEGNSSVNAVADYKVKPSPVVPENSVIFDFNANKWGLGVSSSAESIEILGPINEAPVTFTATSGSTPSRLWNDFNNGIQFRVYKGGGSIVLTAEEGYNIVGVTFDASKFNMTADSGVLENMKWTGEAPVVTFTANATTNINYIIVTVSKVSGIEGVEADKNQTKQIYSIDGRRLQKAQKGINIINGKKVLVK